MWNHVVIVTALALVACASPASQTCEDGRICRQGTLCDDLNDTCVTPDQRAQCAGIADGTRCESDATVGLCKNGACLPGCGDGAAQAGEACDDGNGEVADGCTAACVLEVPAWREVPDPWLARIDHAVAFNTDRLELVVFGGASPAPPGGSAGLRDDTWVRRFRDDGGWVRLDPATAPSARTRHAMVYDAARNRVVLFGGIDAGAALLDDTWEFDGTTWTQVPTTAGPPARADHAMTYDTDRDLVVMLGGNIDDTQVWELDGATWTVRPTSGLVDVKGDGIGGAGLVYDIARSRLVLYEPGALWELVNTTWVAQNQGAVQPELRVDAAVAFVSEVGVLVVGGRGIEGDLGDTWAWKDAQWRRIDSALSPPPRYGAGLAVTNDGAFLVGGSPAQGGVTSAEVWRLAGNVWSRSPVETKPSARTFGAMTYDATRARLVMHGGSDLVSISSDTWTYDGTRWQRVGDPNGPSRYFHNLAYDAKHDRTIMFGGFGQDGDTLAFGTMSWDGMTWNDVSTTNTPPPRIDAGLAYDAARGVIVLHGGVGQGGLGLSDTWELDGTTWTEVTSTGGPQEGVMNLAYDPDRAQLVLVEQSTAVWTYAAGTWTRVTTTGVGPGPRAGASFVHHPGRHAMLLYGGFDGLTYFSDAFELVGTDWQPVVIAGDTPPASRVPSVGMLPATRTMVVFGGLSPTIALDRTFEFAYR